MTINARVDLIKITAKVCEIDGKVFKDDSEFSHHKQVHQQMNYSCDVCSKNVKTRKSLKVHKRLHEDPSSSSHIWVQWQLVCSNAVIYTVS